MSDTVWVPVYLFYETDLAIKVGQDEDNEDDFAWIPKSQIVDSNACLDIGSDVEIEIPIWLAESKGLV